MKTYARLFVLLCLVLASARMLPAEGVLTPTNIASPFAIGLGGGLQVTGGVSQPFFSVLASPPFEAPGIVDILSDLTATDILGDPITSFQVTGFSVTEGASTVTLPAFNFVVTSQVIYYDTENLTPGVVNPSPAYNQAFIFNSDPSFSYSYDVNVTGIPDGGWLYFTDIEGTTTPEPALWIPVALSLTLLARFSKRQ